MSDVPAIGCAGTLGSLNVRIREEGYIVRASGARRERREDHLPPSQCKSEDYSMVLTMGNVGFEASRGTW